MRDDVFFSNIILFTCMLCYIHDKINNDKSGLYIRIVQKCKFGQYLKIYIVVNTSYFQYELQVSLL